MTTPPPPPPPPPPTPTKLYELTAGQLLDIITRAQSVIEEGPNADEHAELVGELAAAADLLTDEIGASHMGTGAEQVLLERSDGGEAMHRERDPHCTCNDCIDYACRMGDEG